MIVEIVCAGFRLRDDTEYVRCSSGAMEFFNDFRIPHCLDSVGESTVIRYSEDNRLVTFPDQSVEDLRGLAAKYGARFEIGQYKRVLVKFN